MCSLYVFIVQIEAVPSYILGCSNLLHLEVSNDYLSE